MKSILKLFKVISKLTIKNIYYGFSDGLQAHFQELRVMDIKDIIKNILMGLFLILTFLIIYFILIIIS